MQQRIFFRRILCLSFVYLMGQSLLQAQYYGVSAGPENEWAVGIQAGIAQIQGDVRGNFPGFQAGLMGMKRLSPAIDIRLHLGGGTQTGQDLDPATNSSLNDAYNGLRDSSLQYPSEASIYHNYQVRFMTGEFYFKFNINRLFAPEQNQVDIYLLGGLSAFFYKTRVDVWNEATETLYDYSQIPVGDQTETFTRLAELRDGTYESIAHRDFLNATRFQGFTVNTPLSVGLGVRFAISDEMTAGLEGRYLLTGDDLIDGQQWTSTATEANQLTENLDRILLTALYVEYNF